MIQNLDTILSFFSRKIEQEVGENPSSPEQLLAVISRHSPNVYRNCNLRVRLLSDIHLNWFFAVLAITSRLLDPQFPASFPTWGSGLGVFLRNHV